MGVQANFMGRGAALPIPPELDLPFGMRAATPLPWGRARREAAGEGALGKNLAQERPPHPALRADLSPKGRGEARLTIAGGLKAITTSFPRKRESLERRRDFRFRGNDAVIGDGRTGLEQALEQIRRLNEYCLLRGRVGL